MDEFNVEDILFDFEREEAHLPFIDIDDADIEGDFEDDIDDDVAVVQALSVPKEDTSPRLAEEAE